MLYYANPDTDFVSSPSKTNLLKIDESHSIRLVLRRQNGP
jgi:hypothetical protein